MPAESAIGKHIKPWGSREWSTVVGVVGDVRHFTMSKGLPAGVAGTIYMPYSQSAREDGQIPAAMTLLAKVESNNRRARADIHQIAEDQDPNVPVGRVRPLEDIVSGSIADFRSTMQVFLSFAGAAIVLAAVGIYGLMSYWVSQRTYEIGLRVAIGATWRQIISMILAQGLRVSLYGVVSGILTALLLTRFLASLLHGVGVTDVLATAFPAWRATRIDPVNSLRSE